MTRAIGLDAAIADLRSRAPAIKVALDEPLASKTTFRIGGPADALVTADDDEEVRHTLAVARDHGVPLFVLGGGSNLLIADRGVRGIVLTLDGRHREIEARDDGVLDVGTAASFPKLTRVALDRGWAPAVGWMGTPGQVGGALRMNAGSRDGEIGEVVIEVRAATPDHIITLRRDECGFAYRTSNFPSGTVLTRALLQCDSHRIEDAKEIDARARDSLARRHRTQPKLRSAGSIFKNPPGDFAGRLIQEAGMKGLMQGGAQISDIHANFIVNRGTATAADVVALAERAAAEVERRFGVRLEWEVRRVGDFT